MIKIQKETLKIKLIMNQGIKVEMKEIDDECKLIIRRIKQNKRIIQKQMQRNIILLGKKRKKYMSLRQT